MDPHTFHRSVVNTTSNRELGRKLPPNLCLIKRNAHSLDHDPRLHGPWISHRNGMSSKMSDRVWRPVLGTASLCSTSYAPVCTPKNVRSNFRHWRVRLRCNSLLCFSRAVGNERIKSSEMILHLRSSIFIRNASPIDTWPLNPRISAELAY